MADKVFCQFKYIPSKTNGEQLAKNIEMFVQPKMFDRKSIEKCGGKEDSVQFTLSRTEANTLRKNLAQVLPGENSPIWFHIVSDPLHSLDECPLQTTDDIRHQGSTFNLSMDFGSLRSSNQFYSHCPFNNQVVEIKFNPARPKKANSLIIEFDDNKKRIVIPFDSIQKKNILVNKEHSNGVLILLPLKYIPNIYRLQQIKDGQHSYTKQTRLCIDEDNRTFINYLSQCSDVVFHFPPSKNMPWVFLNHFLDDRPERYEINFSTFKISPWPKDANKKQRPNPFNSDNSQFQDRYGFQMLKSLGYVFLDKWTELTDQELDLNKWDRNERYALCCFAVEKLSQNHGYDLTRLENDYNETRKKKKSDKNIDEQPISVRQDERLKVACCTLTPTRTIFQPLEVTTGNRALRTQQFGGPERFLLVHFRDEDNKQLRATNENIKTRLKTSMKDGIKLFNKDYIYMGASTGQMKEMGFWYFDLPPSIKRITDAHRILGHVETITNIAIYIARVGQYFSSTWPVGIQLVPVDSRKDVRPNSSAYYVYDIPDIEKKVGKTEYCFTDGIGKVSLGLAGRIAQRMRIPLTCKEDIPSAYQIRVAGCKGMVAIDPESSLNDYYMCIRNSMKKFRSNDWNLEICEFARPMTLTLNNQVIRLLSDLGNDDAAFLALQKRGFTQWQVPEEQQPSAIDIAVQKNFSYTSSKDNLLTNRIPIPPKDGRNMFGVADETGELKYGQCFIQYSSLDPTDHNQRKYHIVTGTILVTKNPCLWPGDFRRLTAVRNSKLEKIMRDVIVFPIDGARPHSNEIAGSDLDGDQYWVYWGEQFKIDKTIDPLSYEGAEKAKEPNITEEKIINHIVEKFGAGIILGMIANTHTVVADKHPDHSLAKPSKELADLFSLAVDSPKTGKFVDKKELRPYQRDYCSSWPEYMRKYGEPQSDSKSVLQTLFTNAKGKFQEIHERPMINSYPQTKKGAIVTGINDKGFEKWLSGDTYKEDITEKNGRAKGRTQKPEKDDESTEEDEATTPKSDQKPVNSNENTNEKKGRGRRSSAKPDSNEENIKEKKGPGRRPSHDGRNTDPPINPEPVAGTPTKKTVPKKKAQEETTDRPDTAVLPKPPAKPNKNKSTDSENPSKLVNSDFGQAGASPSSSTSSFTNNDPSQTDFLLATNGKITASTVIQFLLVNTKLWVVRTNTDPTDNPDQDQIKDKIISYLDRRDVFKKKASVYNEATHGTLYLAIFYGHIYFNSEEQPDIRKFGDLQKLITEKPSEVLRFNYANLNDLNLENTSSATKKNEFDYELDCHLPNSAPENITLLFDKDKKLREIHVYYIWSKCYVRLPNYISDNIYEIRSVIKHKLGSSEFDRISNLVFRTESKDILTDRKPYIKIDRTLLRQTVIPLSLKIPDEDQPTILQRSDIETFYRKVRYVSVNTQQDKPNVFPTLEYYAKSISKDKEIFEEICNYVLSPINKSLLSRRQSAASSLSNQLLGFSMFQN